METALTAGAMVLGIFGCLGNRFAASAVQTLIAMLLGMLAAYAVGCRVLHGAVQVTLLCAAAGAAMLLLSLFLPRFGKAAAVMGCCLLLSVLFWGQFDGSFWAPISALLMFLPAVFMMRRTARLARTAVCAMPVVVGAFELLYPIHRQPFLFADAPLAPALCSYLLLCWVLVTAAGRYLSRAFVTNGVGGI